MRAIGVVAGVLFLSGCLIRTYTSEVPRKDVDIQGNRGYLVGGPSSDMQDTIKKTTRSVGVVEIELGSHKVEDLSSKEESSCSKEFSYESQAQAYEIKPWEEVSEVSAVEPKSVEKEELYTVQANDTLQKISQKFYGTTKKWKFLYEYNMDTLKGPDKIYPGQKIKIPLGR